MEDEPVDETSLEQDDSLELVTASEKEIAKEKKRDIKELPAKKLPSLLRRSYSQWALEHMLIKKISIPEDKEFLRSLFVLGADARHADRYALDPERLYSRRELSRCKSLVKAINSHRGTVRLIPLAATILFILIASAVVTLFKNQIAQMLIVNACEKVFKAKMDIDSVDVQIFGSSLTINHIQVGNRNSQMKNLFEAQKIDVDFNLTELLRGRFDAENLELSGLAFNTDRTYSCYIPGSETSLGEDILETPFMQSVKNRSAEAIDTLYTEVTDVLGGDDINAIVENVQKQLQTPAMFTQTMEFSQNMVTKWTDRPAELKTQVDSFAATIQDLQNLQISSTFDIEVLNANLTRVNNAITASRTIKESASSLVTEVKTDVQSVQTQAQNFTQAAQADIQFAQDKLTSIKNIGANATTIFTSALDSVGYDLLGKYYPYAKQAISYAEELKQKSQSETPEKEKKKTVDRNRMEGTTFWFRPDKPSFLIEKASVSGNGFSGAVTEITNDQNVRDMPTHAVVFFETADVSNTVHLLLDMRRNTTEPLVKVQYTGSGFTAAIDGTTIAAKSGIPSINGKVTVSLEGSGGNNQFSAGGSILVDPVTLSSDGFENALITRYYQTALQSVSAIKVGVSTGYTEARGVWLDLDGNFADQFASALYAVVQTIGTDAKKFALQKIQDEINASQNEVLLTAKQFLGIEGDIDIQNLRITDLQGMLEKKKTEIEAQLKKAAADAVLGGVQQTFGSQDQEAADAASTLLQKWGF